MMNFYQAYNFLTVLSNQLDQENKFNDLRIMIHLNHNLFDNQLKIVTGVSIQGGITFSNGINYLQRQVDVSSLKTKCEKITIQTEYMVEPYDLFDLIRKYDFPSMEKGNNFIQGIQLISLTAAQVIHFAPILADILNGKDPEIGLIQDNPSEKGFTVR